MPPDALAVRQASEHPHFTVDSALRRTPLLFRKPDRACCGAALHAYTEPKIRAQKKPGSELPGFRSKAFMD